MTNLLLAGQVYQHKNTRDLIEAILTLPCVSHRLYGEEDFPYLQHPQTLLEDVIFITTGEYAFTHLNTPKRRIAILGMTSCLQINIFNPLTQELFSSHLNAAYTIPWEKILNLFSDNSYLEIHLIGGNTFLQHATTRENISIVNLYYLLESLLHFLSKNRNISINISAQMLLENNMVFSPRAEPPMNTVSPGQHYSRVMSMIKTQQYTGNIPAQFMRDIIVSLSPSGDMQYEVIFPLGLDESQFVEPLRLIREWLGYGRQFTKEKITLFGICDRQKYLTDFNLTFSTLQEFCHFFEIPAELIKEYVAKYTPVFDQWEKATPNEKQQLRKKIICPGSSIEERHAHLKLLQRLFASS